MAHTYVNVLQVENFTVASTQYSFVVVNSGKVSQLNGGAINGSLLEMGNVVVKNGNLTALEFSTIFVQVTGTATANASKSRIGVMGGGTVFEISAKESLVTSDGGRVVRQNRQSQQKVQQKVQKLQQKKTPTQQKNNNANILTSAIKQQQKNKTQKIQVPQQLKKNQKGMQIAKVVTPVVVQKKVGK